VRGCTLIPEVMSRVVWSLYLASLALLPWSWFPPFPWLHERAQWSDVVFAAASLVWAVDRWRSGEWPRLRPVHAAIALYVTWALVSHLAAGLEPVSGRWKLLGLAELAMLMVVTSDMAGRPGGFRRISRVVAATVVATAAVSILAVCLFYAGVRTPLVGPYGDLLAGPYPRIRAGTFHPNLLASFCIFASFVVARSDSGLSESLRRVTRIALGLTVALTFSRAILSYGLARLLHGAVTRTRRRLVTVYAVCALGALAALTVWNLSLDPSRPWRAQLDPAPSSRWLALASSVETVQAHLPFGVGPGHAAGSRHGLPFDAHSTPVNVLATLGLPALLSLLAIPAVLWVRRAHPTDTATWAALAGIGLDALTQDVEDFRHVWVLLGLADARRHASPPPSPPKSS
jgi:hypothetical protein